jgi:hypothetical protein
MSSFAAKERANLLFKEGQYAAALDEYSMAIDLSTGNEFELHVPYCRRCACFMNLGKFHCALADAQACVRLKPTWAKGYSMIGNCLEKLRRPVEAVSYYLRAGDLDPDCTETRLRLIHLSNATSQSSKSNMNPDTATIQESADDITELRVDESLPLEQNCNEWVELPSISVSTVKSCCQHNRGQNFDRESERMHDSQGQLNNKLRVNSTVQMNSAKRTFLITLILFTPVFMVYWLFLSGPLRTVPVGYVDGIFCFQGILGVGILVAAWKLRPRQSGIADVCHASKQGTFSDCPC